MRKKITIKSTMVQSAINVEETLGTTRFSAVGVEYYRDVTTCQVAFRPVV